MFDPSSITLGQLSSSARDLAIVGVLITSTWKARGVYGSVTEFFQRTMKHMDVMEAGMNTLLTNHLAHIEENLKQMSSNQARVLSGDEVIHVVDDVASEK